jgi:Tfp pilus assembly protein PilO
MRKLLYPVFFLLISGVGFFWYIQPTYADIQDLQETVGEYEQTLSQVNSLQEQLGQKLEKRDAISSDQLSRLNRILPPTVDTVRFLIELDQIAAQHGMSVEDVSFSGAPQAFGGSGGGNESSGYNTLSASFSVSGSYSDIQDFMRDIERSSRLMDFTNFSLEAPGNTSSSQGESSLRTGTNQYNITLETYWRNQDSS